MWKRLKRLISSFIILSLAISLLALIFVGFVLFIWFPRHDINENGDLTIKLPASFMIDYLEIQVIQTNVETLDTDISYYIANIEENVDNQGYYSIISPSDGTFNKNESELIISNNGMTIMYNALFVNSGDQCIITFGNVQAIIKLQYLVIIITLYIVIALVAMPCYFYKKF